MGQTVPTDWTSRPLTPEAMAHEIMSFAPASNSEALKILRSHYPGAPLALRVAALAFLMRERPMDDLARFPT